MWVSGVPPGDSTGADEDQWKIQELKDQSWASHLYVFECRSAGGP